MADTAKQAGRADKSDAIKQNGTFTVPTAPVSSQRDLVPHMRHKRYAETRPNDFQSLKEVPDRDDLLRLIVGRLLTADGHDLQDDYTLPIEKQFWHRPLGFILKHTYCQARGIRDTSAELSVRFMLAEAGSGLGWLDVSQSPVELGLKDIDIVEVLVMRKGGTNPEGGLVGALLESLDEDGRGVACKPQWSPGSWQEALELIKATEGPEREEPGCWIPKVWVSMEKYAQDDNVVLPGLRLLLSYVSEEGPASKELVDKSRAHQAAGGQDGINTLRSILDLHSKNRAVQQVAWRLLSDFAAEPLLQPLLVQRQGAFSLATRAERAGELDGQSLEFVRRVLERLANVPRPTSDGLSGASPFARPLRQKQRGERSAVKSREAQEEGLTPEERRRQACESLRAKLKGAMDQCDTMVVDKTLRKLLKKLQGREVDSRDVEAAGLGPLLGELRSFEGDADIRDLARQAITATAKLQQASRASR